MNAFVKEVTEHKHEKQELLSKMETLKQKIGKLDYQLRILKENLYTYISPQAEADNIEDIPPNIAGNAVTNALERIVYDAEQEEHGAVEAILLRIIMGSLNIMWTHQSEHC